MDPLASILMALRPRAAGVKLITGKGAWGARYAAVDNAGFGLVLTGACWLRVGAGEPVRFAEGDFVLMPPNPGFAIYTDAQAPLRALDASASAGLAALRHGDPEGDPSFRMIGGYFQCEPANAGLIAGLLPALLHVRREHRAARRLHCVMELIADEALSDRPGRDLVVERLVETLLLEALRCRAGEIGALAQPGLLEGLDDPQLARALRRIHAQPAERWTVAALARESGLSRSTFSERFLRKVGLAPMEYVMRWRMALAKDMLCRGSPPMEAVAAAIGYESASAFSTAFRREVGRPPSHFARA
ncbi:MAG: AraC family transcriptional regulator [Rhizobiaceae bacterium]|jgi:AraC-like DNA-binding protein|nr:AraC family transcriptional regulator [Rhizobiaceae bacterium]